MRIGWLLSLAVAVGAGRLPGQRFHTAAAASVVTARVRTEQFGGAAQFSGAAFGAGGTLSLGRFQVGLSYLQGRLDPDTGSARARDLVEGAVLLGVRPVEWLTLSCGPHARAYAASGQTQRWLFWEVRVRAAKPFIGSARAPLEGRIGYRIDHAVLGGGTRLETVDGVVIGVGLAWR